MGAPIRTCLSGQVCHSWTILSEAEPKVYQSKGKTKKRRRVLCRCVCGHEKIISANTIYRGLSRQCRRCAARVDIVGEVFGSLTVVDRIDTGTGGDSVWKCLCVCGSTHHVTTGNLTSGGTKSCGCRPSFTLKHHPSWSGHEAITGTEWGKVKSGAKSRDIKFDLTIKQAWSVFQKQNGKCALTHSPLRFKQGSRDYNSTASLDRIDSALDYTLDNVQWVHKHINLMKRGYSQDYFIELCKLVATAHT